MFLFHLIICLLCLAGIRINRKGLNPDYLEKKQTDSIKGIFILLVYLRHSIDEVLRAGFHPEGLWDIVGLRVDMELGQLIVVMFLFYSGYGVMESFKNKGETYTRDFPRRRILTTLLNFDVAVLSFICLNLILGIRMNPRQIGLSFIGWDSIGNSNWYIFVILYCYLCSWVGRIAFSSNEKLFVLFTTLLVFVGYVSLAFVRHGEGHWYTTIMCYPAGMLYSSFMKEKHIALSRNHYFLILALLLALVLFLHFQRWIPGFHGATFNIKSILFSLLVVHITLKLSIGNQFLRWAGRCLFPIYIYQRLPMISIRELAGIDWICSNPYLFIVVCAMITGCIAFFYKKWQISLK